MSRSRNSSKGMRSHYIGFSGPTDGYVVSSIKGKRWSKRFYSKHRRLWDRNTIRSLTPDDLDWRDPELELLVEESDYYSEYELDLDGYMYEECEPSDHCEYNDSHYDDYDNYAYDF